MQPSFLQDTPDDKPQVKTDWSDRPQVKADGRGKPPPTRDWRKGPAARKKLTYPPKRAQAKSGRRKVDFKNALYKVLRKIDPNGTISSKAMDALNDMMRDLLERLASEAASVREKSGHTTLMSRDIQTAARLILPGALFTHAFYEAHRALRSSVESQRA